VSEHIRKFERASQKKPEENRRKQPVMTLMIFMIVCSRNSGDSGIVLVGVLFVGVLFQTKVLAQDAPRIRSAFRFEGAIT
jgi:hypothetical protein